MIKKSLVINGVQRILIVEPHETLATVLREHLLLTGCKIGCGEGHCGACNVILDGKVTRSCLLKMEKIRDNAEITTIEGVGTLHDMHPLQVAWMAYGGAQCGFCTPGFIISAKVLLDKNPNPTREEVRDWFNKNRNLCRCTGYKPLIDATMAAAAVMRGEMSKEDLCIQAHRRQHQGHEIHPSLRRAEGHRHLGLRRRRRAQDARKYSSPRPHAGHGISRQHQEHRYLRGREDARRL